MKSQFYSSTLSESLWQTNRMACTYAQQTLLFDGATVSPLMPNQWRLPQERWRESAPTDGNKESQCQLLTLSLTVSSCGWWWTQQLSQPAATHCCECTEVSNDPKQLNQRSIRWDDVLPSSFTFFTLSFSVGSELPLWRSETCWRPWLKIILYISPRWSSN